MCRVLVPAFALILKAPIKTAIGCSLTCFSANALVTGTTIVNGTFDRIWELVKIHGKDYIVYGVTGAGVGELMGLNRMCPYGYPG